MACPVRAFPPQALTGESPGNRSCQPQTQLGLPGMEPPRFLLARLPGETEDRITEYRKATKQFLLKPSKNVKSLKRRLPNVARTSK